MSHDNVILLTNYSSTNYELINDHIFNLMVIKLTTEGLPDKTKCTKVERERERETVQNSL